MTNHFKATELKAVGRVYNSGEKRNLGNEVKMTSKVLILKGK